MAKGDDVERLTQEWRAGVIAGLGTLERKLDETSRQVNERFEDTRHEITELKLAAKLAVVKQDELEVMRSKMDIQEKRIDDLVIFKTKTLQTFLVAQVILFGAWALFSRFIKW